MTSSTPERLLDDAFVALADPTRREILRRLAAGEARVTVLAAPFAISLNSVSKHIKLLERAGLVVRRKVGREHLLRFQPNALREAREWIAKLEAFWKAGLAELDELLTKEDESRESSDGRKG